MQYLRNKYLLLFILPIVYLFFTGVFFLTWQPFYTIGPDPMYIYLSTGMNVAGGHLKVFYIDNPGVPVQYFCAAVIYIRHLFNLGVPLYQDVLSRPENYLYTLCLASAIIYALVTWLTGKYVYKHTGNLALSLLFQITPLLCVHGILTTGRPSPESFYIIGGMFFMAYLYCNIITKPDDKTSWKQVAVYGAFTAFFISCKYICFPLVLLVLIAVPGFRSKLKYLFSFTIFLFIFMSPSIPAWRNIQQWLFNLATHTGQYGQGAKGFINTSEFLPNLQLIFKQDFYFTFFFVLLVAIFILASVRYGALDETNKKHARLLAGVAASSLVLILLVAKHYSFHYLISVQLCYPIIVASSFQLVKSELRFNLFQSKWPVVLFYCFFIFLIYIQLHTFIKYAPHESVHTTANFLSKYHDEPIIMDVDFESSRLEPSEYLGVAYTGDYRNHYWEYLKKIFPYSYQYKEGQHAIGYWDDIFYPPELFAKYSKAIIYFVKKDSGTRHAVLNQLCYWANDTLAHSQLVYAEKAKDEYIYELTAKQDDAKAIVSKWTETDFDLEKLSSDKSSFISVDGKDTAQGVNLVSNKEHHSGNNSILMNWQNQYGLNYNIRAYPGNMVIADIWRKSNDDNGCIILSSKTDGDFYVSGQTAVDSDANGWKKIQYKCLVPTEVKDSAVFFYLYYPGHGYAYFDDLSVKVYPMKK